jgi:hypothetical protein
MLLKLQNLAIHITLSSIKLKEKCVGDGSINKTNHMAACSGMLFVELQDEPCNTCSAFKTILTCFVFLTLNKKRLIKLSQVALVKLKTLKNRTSCLFKYCKGSRHVVFS